MEIRPLSSDGSDRIWEMKSATADRLNKLATAFVTALAFSSFAFWWPRFSNIARFAFLSCFPAIFPFFFALVRSKGGLREPRNRRAVITMAVIHCVLLLGLIFAWRAFSANVSIGNPDTVFGFMAVEVTAVIFLGRILGRANNPKEK